MIYLHEADFNALLESFPAVAGPNGQILDRRWRMMATKAIPPGHVFDSSMPEEGIMPFRIFWVKLERREQLDHARAMREMIRIETFLVWPKGVSGIPEVPA